MKPLTKRALIIGIRGQDGSYLGQFLLEKGYEVHGTTRNVSAEKYCRLQHLAISERVQLHSINPQNYKDLIELISTINPDEIYNLSAQSSVGQSFQEPIDTLNSITSVTLNVLEVLRELKSKSKLYNASSSEMFGDTAGQPANECTPLRPHSPYGVAKAAAHWLVKSYRSGYGMFACSGILFNHESPLRDEHFVTQKIVRGAVDILEGKSLTLSLGNSDIIRDWGWAPEYVEGMWHILQHDRPTDFVLATGKPMSLKEFTALTFKCLNLNWEDYVTYDATLFRPYDISVTVGDPQKALVDLGWRARTEPRDVVTLLVEAELLRRKDL